MGEIKLLMQTAPFAGAGIVERLWLALVARFQGPQGWLYWSIIGLVLLLLVVFSTVRSKRKNRQQQVAIIPPKREPRQPKEYLPVEQDQRGLELIFLPITDKILAARNHLGWELTQKIREKSPKVLNDIVEVYERISPELQNQLAVIVREEHMLAEYSRNLDQNGYSEDTLIIAWHYFPQVELLKNFVELLGHRQEAVQMKGVKLLSTIKEPKSMTYLAAALVHPEHFVPARVVEVFISFGPQAAKLMIYLLSEFKGENRARGLETLAQIKVEYPLQPVINCLQDSDARVREQAALTLGETGNPEAIEALGTLVQDHEWRVRTAVAKALGMIASQDALPLLQRLAADDSWWVSVSAKEALSILDQRAEQTNG